MTPLEQWALIHIDEEGPFTWCDWDQISADALVSSRTSDAGPTFGYADRDWWTLLTILSKVEWMKTCHRQEELDDEWWMYYGATEVDFFHVRFRSILDHLAALLARCAEQPGRVQDTFFKLKKHLNDPRKKRRFGPLGDDVLELLEEASWTEEVRNVRNDIVHQGADTLVFPDKDEVLFQVHQREKKLVVLEGVMHNENIVDFRQYSALTLGLFVDWRERVAALLRRGIALDGDPPGDGRNLHGGLQLLRDWSQLLLESRERLHP